MDKKELRQTFKQLKSGMIKWESLPQSTKDLLKKYYGYE